MMITYRELALEECKDISSIDCSEWIENVWRTIDGEMQLVPLKWDQVGWPDDVENYINELETIIRQGGKAFGAFHEEDGLIGISSISNQFFGTTAKYLLLDSMFVSKPYRGQGLGREMFQLCCKQADLWGADKVYLCAASSENTVRFYKSLGCTMAQEVNQELYNEDPRDVQMEFDLAMCR